jgi:hypothetical protein
MRAPLSGKLRANRVSSAASTASGTGTPPLAHPGAAGPPRSGLTRGLIWASGIGIGTAILIMIGVSTVRHSMAVPLMPWPPGIPPLEFSGRLPPMLVYLALWAAALLGGGGVIAGLAALARGARFPARPLLAASFVAVAAFTVLQPAGSTDTLSYASYGRIAAIGHNPYLMTPNQLRLTGDPVGQLANQVWKRQGSLYGPLATVEQRAAADLGGTSAARIVFWLKLWNALLFCAIALGLDRLLRSDPARRARAHLLWSLNPLLLWALIAAGHLDVLAAGASILALTLVRGRPQDPVRGNTDQQNELTGLLTGLAAGVLIGVAADFMLTYLLLGVALLWALRRQALAFGAALAGICVTVVPAYLPVGSPLIRALLERRGKASADNIYHLFPSLQGQMPPAADVAIVLGFLALATLLLRRLPDAAPRLPAIQPALALGLAWLFLWYYQLPWYDTMIIGLLALYPASRLDYVVMWQFTAGTFALMPGGSSRLPPHGLLTVLNHDAKNFITPIVLIAAVVALVLLCITGDWDIQDDRLDHAGRGGEVGVGVR